MKYIASSILAISLLVRQAKADGLYITHSITTGLVVIARHLLRGIEVTKNCRYPYSVCDGTQETYRTFRSLRAAIAFIAGE